jgi:hypothetical protein
VCADTQTDMLAGLPASATCVQRFDDSRVLQFTLRIAFCCVLHRCGSQDILRHEFLKVFFSLFRLFFLLKVFDGFCAALSNLLPSGPATLKRKNDGPTTWKRKECATRKNIK